MKRIAFLILLCTVLVYAHAETIVLRTGARVKGEIVFQNEQVVIVRNAETGGRIQYPRTDVAEILSDDEADTPEVSEQPSEEPKIQTPKKTSILIEVAGGAAVIPNEAAGGMASADLLVGSHHIGSRHLFIGGGLGYHGLFLSNPDTTSTEGTLKYNFLPIQVALRMPFMETKHAPVFGMSVGYGVALSKNYLGGIYAGADFGYRCQLNPKTAISLVAFARFQQAQVPVTTIIDGEKYTNRAGRNIVTAGLKLAIYL